mmetsp:Transcript_12408/g.41330  ORF Transcript_12408/g.41330 Transcript_12408/m.41330 type:complete len:237 (-) Transcript_12408:881-1591(-)
MENVSRQTGFSVFFWTVEVTLTSAPRTEKETCGSDEPPLEKRFASAMMRFRPRTKAKRSSFGGMEASSPRGSSRNGSKTSSGLKCHSSTNSSAASAANTSTFFFDVCATESLCHCLRLWKRAGAISMSTVPIASAEERSSWSSHSTLNVAAPSDASSAKAKHSRHTGFSVLRFTVEAHFMSVSRTRKRTRGSDEPPLPKRYLSMIGRCLPRTKATSSSFGSAPSGGAAAASAAKGS